MSTHVDEAPVEVVRKCSQDRVQQHIWAQIIQIPAISFVKNVVDLPMIQTQEETVDVSRLSGDGRNLRGEAVHPTRACTTANV